MTRIATSSTVHCRMAAAGRTAAPRRSVAASAGPINQASGGIRQDLDVVSNSLKVGKSDDIQETV